MQKKLVHGIDGIRMEMREKAIAQRESNEIKLFSMRDENLPPERRRFFELKRKRIMERLELEEAEQSNKNAKSSELLEDSIGNSEPATDNTY